MGTITAEAALILVWENNPPPIVSSDLLAGRSDIWKDGSTDTIIPAIGIVYPFFVVNWVVKLLPFDLIVDTVDEIGLVEACIVGVVVGWWGFCLEGKNSEEYQQ